MIFKKCITALLMAAGLIVTVGCADNGLEENMLLIKMEEKQITFSPKTHALDQNDNFSPDGIFLCYDTRATVYSENLANSKSVEKVEISTGLETILWNPPSVTGEDAAPGIAAVSYHPSENKVIFIHGPNLDELKTRGYYGIRNRTAMEVDGNGNLQVMKVEMRDIVNNTTIPGAHRGGTHRHEYTRSGNRIGFTYDDFFVRNIGRTIGFMQPNDKTPAGYTHFFALILKPAENGKSKPGEIEKASDDSWVDSLGTMRAFVGKVRADNGVDYYTDIFVADIPLDIDVTTAFPGTREAYPLPPSGIKIRRLTIGMNAAGIVRGSSDGKRIAFTAKGANGVSQVFIVNAHGSNKPIQASQFEEPAEYVRWHPSGKWIYFISGGNIYMAGASIENIGKKPVKLTADKLGRTQLVISQDGNVLAYVVRVLTKDESGNVAKDVSGSDYRQVFVMDIDWSKIEAEL